jgi:hypothetical protein
LFLATQKPYSPLFNNNYFHLLYTYTYIYSAREEIKVHFDCSATSGNLTRHGFVQLYSLQTCAEPEETWRDLKKLGYNDKLEKLDDNSGDDKAQ